MPSEHITVVSGSHRKDSQSEKIARFISPIISGKGFTSEVFSLAGNPVPLWDEGGLQAGDSEFNSAWKPVSSLLDKSDGFVIVVPEWAGMVPSGLKNLLLLATKGELSHKPALIVSVSAGINGAYPVSELRMSGYKNSRICFIPEHVIVRNVADVCNGETPADSRDTSIRERINFSLDILAAYTRALKEVRSSSIDFSKYPNGM
jgi:NAD(P)H-dependent FMN reductase